VDEHRTRLGRALIERADDVAVAVIDRVWPEGTENVDADVLEAIAETDRVATQLIGAWLTGGTNINEEKRQSFGALGGMIERVSLDALVKAYLAWRDTTVTIVDEEAAKLSTPPELVAEVRAVVTRSNDGSMVRMARSFEQERQRLHQLLAEQALHDELTGLPNRVLLFDRIEHALRVSTRTDHPLAILFIDLDGFKAVNDHHGHLAGSQALVEAAGVIRVSARETDVVARFGGDEFAIVLPDTGTDGAMAVGDRVRELIASHRFLHGEGLSIALTVSVGVATLPDVSISADGLIHAADTAMYWVKDRGKNGIHVAV
jgi:diguanylate cyclase (GGDEF)-like protein